MSKYNSEKYKLYYQKNRDKCLAKSRRYVREHKDELKARRKPRPYLQNRNASLKHNYNITLDQYQQLFVNQNGCCAICKLPSQDVLHVDHNHITKQVRGLLCSTCNRFVLLVVEKYFNRIELAKQYLNGSVHA